MKNVLAFLLFMAIGLIGIVSFGEAFYYSTLGEAFKAAILGGSSAACFICCIVGALTVMIKSKW
jgi:hypothetical protein